MNLNILFLLTALALLYAPGINAAKRIKRNTKVKLHNSLKDDFVVLKTDNQDSEHLSGGLRKKDKRDPLNNDSNEMRNKTDSVQHKPLVMMLPERKVYQVSTNRPNRRRQSPRKLIMHQIPAQRPQLLQHFYEPNKDPIYDLIFNSLEGPQTLFANTKTISGESDNPYEEPQTRTIIYAPPAMFKQQMHFQQPKQELESLMENALNNLLLDEDHDMNEGGQGVVDLRCPIHYENKRGGNRKQPKESVNDADVIQFCSCHFIKKSKGGGDIKNKK